jgi:hypothetical protein
MDQGTELLLRTMQEGFAGVQSRLDRMAATQAEHGERIARLETLRQQARGGGLDMKKFFVGLAGLTGIVLVLYEIGQAVFDVITRIRG